MTGTLPLLPGFNVNFPVRNGTFGSGDLTLSPSSRRSERLLVGPRACTRSRGRELLAVDGGARGDGPTPGASSRAA